MALVAVRGDKTLAELAQQHNVHPNQITDWKNQLLTKAADVFGSVPRPDEPKVDLKALHAKIGQLALENDFSEGALIKPGMLGDLAAAVRRIRHSRATVVAHDRAGHDRDYRRNAQ